MISINIIEDPSTLRQSSPSEVTTLDFFVPLRKHDAPEPSGRVGRRGNTARTPLGGAHKSETPGAHRLAPVHNLDVHYLHVVNLFIHRTVRLLSVSEGPIKVKRGTDQCEVSERLREIS
jgi:hypothetical protein